MTINLSTKGFTLIEIAIVLVIVGLLVGGVLVGGDLIEHARIRATLSQIERINTAVATFRVKYACLPGDCNNATSFLGGTSSGCFQMQGGFGANENVWPNITDPNNGTCNGDGDGVIEGDVLAPGNDYGETSLFTDHLTKAGLIEGQYLGPYYFRNGTLFAGASAYGTIPSKGLGKQISLQPRISPNSGIWPAAFGKSYYSIGIMNINIGVTSSLITGLLTPAQAHAIDTIIDDSYPNTGNVLGISANASGTDHADCFGPNVVWNYTSFTAPVTYNLGNNNVANPNPNGCFIFVRTGF